MFTNLPDSSPARQNKRPSPAYHPPSSRASVPVSTPASTAQPSQHRKKKTGPSCNKAMCASLLALPWITFMLCGIIIAATIAWQNYFLEAAKKTGEVLTLVDAVRTMYSYKLWRPHHKVVIGTAISMEVITLFVVLAAILRMMQGALKEGKIKRGPTHHVWSSVYLALTGGCATLLWFAMWWMVMLLGVSAAWQFGAVTSRNISSNALEQNRAFSQTNVVNLAAPNAPQLVTRRYQRVLRPLLTPRDQGLTDKFLAESITPVSDVCPSTCYDAWLLKGALGSAQCVCDVKKIQQISDLSSSVAKLVISMISCLICNGVAASLLVVNLVYRFFVARAEYVAAGPYKKKAAVAKGDKSDDDEDGYDDEENDEEKGFADGGDDDDDEHDKDEKVIRWQNREPSEQSIPVGFQNPQVAAVAAAQAQRLQQQQRLQQMQQLAQQQQRQREQMAAAEARKQQQQQQQQHYSYAQQMQQQRHRADSVAGSDQASQASAWVMLRPGQ